MPKFHIEQTAKPAGLVAQDASASDETLKLWASGWLTSDHPMFQRAVLHFSGPVFEKVSMFPDAVYRFLCLWHRDGSAHLYVNDFNLQLEFVAKEALSAGDLVRLRDVADVRRLLFPGISVVASDSVAFLLKVRWKFGLYFDFARHAEDLDVDGMPAALGQLYRFLAFESEYQTLASRPRFDQLLAAGWFPFVELLGDDFEELARICSADAQREARVSEFLKRFDADRISRITSRWWNKGVFGDKRELLEAGLEAYSRGSRQGYIQCIKTLLTELDGILRKTYYKEKKTEPGTVGHSVEYLVQRGTGKASSDESLYFPPQFGEYLRRVVFKGFSLSQGDVKMSRHSSAHGVADASAYDRARAIQAILALDQVSFYL